VQHGHVAVDCQGGRAVGVRDECVVRRAHGATMTYGAATLRMWLP
jgi:hypothetical protein